MAGVRKQVSAILMAATVIAVVEGRGGAITCEDVMTYMEPCVRFVTVPNADITKDCCNGVRQVARNSGSVPNLLTICGCLKNNWQNGRKISPEMLSILPFYCSVDAPYIAVTQETDCAQFKN